MKERPIHLRLHEAAAIVAGRQTQLRRLVKLNAAGRLLDGVEHNAFPATAAAAPEAT